MPKNIRGENNALMMLIAASLRRHIQMQWTPGGPQNKKAIVQNDGVLKNYLGNR
jgi:hypothetical protein